MSDRHLDRARKVLPAALLALATAWAGACGQGATSVAGPTASKCQISVTSFTRSFSASGGTGTVSLTAARECDWSASSSTTWISFPRSHAGQGPGSFTFVVGSNDVPQPREGRIDVSGQRLAVAQEPAPCRYSLDADGTSASAAGGRGLVKVSTLSGCTWTSRSAVSWIQMLSGSSGNGPGEVLFSIEPNTGAARSGNLVVAGRTYRVEQASPSGPTPPPPCSYALSPPAATVPAAGGTLTLALATGSGCAWTASDNAGWVTVQPPTTGTGPASIVVRVAENTSTSARQATVSAESASMQLTQEAAGAPPPPTCTFSVSPTSASLPAAGGSIQVDLSTGGGCAWTTATSQSWLSVSPAGGTGSRAVSLSAAANTAATPRSATATIAGIAVTVTQDAAAPPTCTFSVAPTSLSLPASGGSADVQVSAGAGCEWTANTSASWLSVSPASGTGSRAVSLTAAANTATSPRSATATIAGVPVAVTQDAAAPTPVQVSGKIKDLAGACPDRTFGVKAETISTNSSTLYGPASSGRTCGDLLDGATVTVTGFRQSGTIVATTVVFASTPPHP